MAKYTDFKFQYDMNNMFNKVYRSNSLGAASRLYG